MSYKLIVVHLEESDDNDIRIEISAKIARAEGAHLIGLATSGLRQTLLNAPSALTAAKPGVAPYVASARERLISSLDRFDAIVADMKLASVEKRTCNGDPISDICNAARCSDLLVVGHGSRNNASEALHDASRLVMEAGSPVLLIPSGQQRQSLPKNILIAWDGSTGASRAVRGALPLLRQSASVMITMVNPSTWDHAVPSDRRGALILSYLNRQGVTATAHSVTTDESVGKALLDTAGHQNADLIVMGCYGRSPLQEKLFGGTTRQVLSNPAQSLFLSY